MADHEPQMAGHEGTPESSHNEEDPRIERLIRYKESLVKCLDSTVLVNHLSDILTPEQRENVRREKDSKGETAAARLLLENVIGAKRHPHRFSRLRDILDAENHDQALNVLSGDEMKRDALFGEIMDLLRPYVIQLLGRIDCELTNHLMSGGCITDNIKQKIDNIRRRENDLEAATELLDQVKRLAAGWPAKFVAALRAGGNHEDLVELLSDFLDEPVYNKKSPTDDANKSNYKDNETEKSDDSRDRHATSDAVAEPSLHYEAPAADDGFKDNLDAPLRTETNLGDDTGHVHGAGVKEAGLENEDKGTSNSVSRQYDREFLLKIGSIKTFPKPKDWKKIQKIPKLVRRTDPHTTPSDDADNENAGQATGGVDRDDHEEHCEKHDSESCKENEGRKEELVLRNYQASLAQAGIEGKNAIITAQTGSGKTVVAAAIMKAHLKKVPKKNKVIFLVCDVALANQQYEKFKTFLSEFESIELSSEKDNALPIKLLLEKYDILVMTAQLLVNEMIPKTTEFGVGMNKVTFDDFSMMVFDECHHTASGHPYNILMGKYVDQKLHGKTSLPQVLGLTASLGVAKAKDTEAAIRHILTMCANLDAQELCYPDEEMQKEIEASANTPQMTTVNVPSRNPDPFLDLVSETMSEIEKKLINACEGGGKAVQINPGSIPADKGGQPYIQWISRVVKPIEASTELSDLNRQRALKYLQYLKAYNKGLLINQECRTRDALEYLRQQFRRMNFVKISGVNMDDFSDMFEDDDDDDSDAEDAEEEQETVKDREQQWLEQQYKDLEPTFLEISLDPHNKNPMLVKLKEMILEKFSDERSKSEARGIIFVETREMTVALCRWIKEDEDIKVLNPDSLVGANAKDPGPTSTTQTNQLNILKLFKDGKHKVIVATSVAEEGLDISKCNWVIRYNKVTNEIAMVQSRGRARAEGSTYEVLTGGTLGPKKAQKENLNKIREVMMTRAMKKISTWPKEKFQKFINKYQVEASDERKIAAALLEDKYADGELHGPFIILCKFCKTNLCAAVELRKLAGTHRSVLSDEFKDRYKTVLCDKPQKPVDDVEFVGKIFCTRCDDDLGVLAQYKSVQFPLLKIKSLLVKDGSGNNKAYKKWKDVPFQVEDITQAELQRAAKLSPKSKVQN